MRVHRGCVTLQTGELPFDCDAGFSDRATAWSDAKKTWCCTNLGRGCQMTTNLSAVHPGTQPPFDCGAGLASRGIAWSHAKKQWCCTNLGLACKAMVKVTTTAASVLTAEQSDGMEANMPFKCVEARVAEWAADEAAWCCSNLGRGCATSFDCLSGLSSSIHDWPPEKKKWCCEHAAKGCDVSNKLPRTEHQLEGLSVKYDQPTRSAMSLSMSFMQVSLACAAILPLVLCMVKTTRWARTWVGRVSWNSLWMIPGAELQLAENRSELACILE